jgi:hypothetical protein
MVAATCVAALSLVSGNVCRIHQAAPAAAIGTGPSIRLQVISPARLADRALETMVDQAAAIWAPYGVTVTATRQLVRSQDYRGDWITLVIRDSPEREPGAIRRGERRQLAGLAFAGGVPGSLMTASWNVAREMVAAAGLSRPAGDETLAARLLGRAVAHEIGHYLLRTREHAARGLMRVAFTVRDVVDDETGFRLEPAQFLALEAQTAASRRRPDAGRNPEPPVSSIWSPANREQAESTSVP